MNKIINIFAFLFAAFLLFSCEPGRAENGDFLFGVNQGETGGGGGGGTTVAKVLSKSFSHSFNDETNEWEDVTTNYNYENKKLVSITTDGETINITYNSNDKIAKIEGNGLLTTFTYNANKQATELTNVFGGMPFNTSKFFYDGSNKLVKIDDLSALLVGIPIQLGREDTFTYSGSNIVKSVSVYRAVASGATSTTDTVTANFSYDTKIAPVSTLPFEFRLFTVSLGGVNSFTLSKNNMLSGSFVSMIDGTTTNTFTYEYDEDGYAKKAIDGDEYTTFDYIKL